MKEEMLGPPPPPAGRAVRSSPQTAGSLERRDLLRSGAALAAAASLAGPSAALGRRRAPLGARLSSRAPLRALVPKGCEANLAPVVKLFAAHTGVQVEVESTTVDDVATVLLLRSLGDASAGFDIALPATFTIPDLVEAGALRPLPDPAATSEGEAPGDTGALYTLGDRYKGKIWGYQTDGDVYLMFYRRDWLEDDALRARYEDRYGEPLGVPRTWEEVDRALEFFHAPDEGRFGGALFRTPTYIAWEFWTRLHGKGLFPVADDMTPLLDADEAVAAAEELIAASRWLHPGVGTHGLFENWDAYKTMDVFCNIGWGGSQKAFHAKGSPLRGRLAHGPTPGGILAGAPRPISYFNWGWNYTVPRDAAQPELAAEFARFATLGEAATAAVRAPDGFFDPFRTEHYADEAVADAYSKEFLDVHEASMRSAVPDFYLAGRGRYFDVLGRFLDRANRGELEVRRALNLVAKAWDRITDEQGRERQAARWLELKARYPEPLRSALRSERS